MFLSSNVKKKVFRFLIITMLAALLLLAGINIYISGYSRKYIYYSPKKVPASYTVLVLGAAVYRGGRLSPILYDRMATALQLYRLGKVKAFLLSGDHGTRHYDEVSGMKKFLLKQGIPPNRIFLDHAGFNTYNSMVRARKIFRVTDVVIVTQRFHLSRALFIARKSGLVARGCVADRHTYRYIRKYRIREFFARIKAFFDVISRSKPHFLGKVIPITGDGRKSWN